MLERKCEANGHLLIRVSRWFPSSKTCFHCGYVHKDLKLSDRIHVCPKCGRTMDRDGQAAANIDREGLRVLMELYEGEAAVKAA